VENLAHTIVGATLAKSGLDRKTPLATAALIVGANLPDIDNLGVFFGMPYLDIHRGITHGFAGALVLSLALAGFLWVLRSRASPAEKRPRFLALWCLSGIAILSHLLLDFLGAYGLRPWLPFSDTWYYGDLLRIVDPWIWIIFGSPLFLTARSLMRKSCWVGLALLLASLLGMTVGVGLALIWCGALLLFSSAGHVIRKWGVNPAGLSLLVFVVYLAGVWMAHQRVLGNAAEMSDAIAGAPVRGIHALPSLPGRFWAWTIVIETTDRYFIGDVGLRNWSEDPPEFDSYEKRLQDPHYQAALYRQELTNFSRFARFPFVTIERSGQGIHIILRDLRYARSEVDGWGVVKVILQPEKNHF
jgi:inner membrane protein